MNEGKEKSWVDEFHVTVKVHIQAPGDFWILGRRVGICGDAS